MKLIHFISILRFTPFDVCSGQQMLLQPQQNQEHDISSIIKKIYSFTFLSFSLLYHDLCYMTMQH